MIIKGSLGYDQHGRKRKRLRTKRKSHKSTWTQGAVAVSYTHLRAHET